MATQVQPLLPKNGLEEPAYREGESLEGLKAIYGDDFPHAQLEGEGPLDLDDSWLSWARGRWSIHGPAVRPRLHMVERNRLVALGVQYISSTDGRTWSEPRKRRDEARIVHNVIEPALDQRLQVVNENRPGFKTRPTRREPDFLKRAEAQQIALENQYDQQRMPEVRKVATYWALRDGVSFIEQYWDPDRGPWHQAGEGTMGDLCNRVHRIEHVRVAANANTIDDPYYWVIKRPIPLQAAVATYGEAVIEKQRDARSTESGDEMLSIRAYRRLGLEIPGEDPLLEEVETVDELTVYCAPHGRYLPEGLAVKCVGDAVVYVGPLPFGVPPMVRWTDGSSDPSFFPKAIMEQWIDHQMRLNQIISRWVERVRRDGGTLLARANTLGRETMVTGGMTVVEVNGGVQLDQAVYPIKPVPLSGDAKELWALTLKAFEDVSGYNDQSRGTFSAEQSGRSILAQRETLERIFAPPVNAASQAMKDWAKVTLHGMKFGYDEPRTMASMGAGRPDLGRALTQDDFDGICDVEIDPETLMPMPRSLKLFHLDQLFDRKIIDAGEYRRRYPFAFVQDIQTPDSDHLARAKRVAEALIRMENPPPVRWQDNEAIHQDILERDIILRDDLPEEVVQAAHGRWVQLWMQAQQKMAAMMPPAPAPSLGGGGGGFGGPALLPPAKQPLLGTSPSVPAAPVRDIAMKQDQELAASQFDAIQPT